jgi:hypothetical protein
MDCAIKQYIAKRRSLFMDEDLDFLDQVVDDFDQDSAFQKMLEKDFEQQIEKDFQQQIQQTMDQLKTSAEKDPMDSMFAQLDELVDSGDFDNVFGELMNDLVTKDLLYEPLKELQEKYPAWIEKNSSSLKPDQLEQYQNQLSVIGEIINEFDDNPDSTGDKITMLMAKAISSNSDAVIRKSAR